VNNRFEAMLPDGRMFAEEAERGALGVMLLDVKAIDAAASLQPVDFGLDSHRRIFSAIRRLHDAGKAVDEITLREELRRTKELDSVGGVGYIPRQNTDVLVESWVRDALLRLNLEIAEQPDRADEVIYNLRACILSVHADGLVRASENFMLWLRGEKTMPFGIDCEHVSVRLIDAGDPANNRLTVCNQWTYQIGSVEKRFDVVFLVNGLPVIVGEAKTPTRSSVTWFDGAYQLNEIYEKQVPAMFVPNGKDTKRPQLERALEFLREGGVQHHGCYPDLLVQNPGCILNSSLMASGRRVSI
jgi:hypothetical protein